MTTPASIAQRIARLEGSFEQIERRLGTLEQDLRSLRAEISAGFDRLGTRLDRLEARIEQVDARSNARIDRLMYWQLGLLGAIAASILATVLTRVL